MPWAVGALSVLVLTSFATVAQAAFSTATVATPRMVLFVDPCTEDALTEVTVLNAACAHYGAAVIPVWSNAMSEATKDEELHDALLDAPAAGDELRWASEIFNGASLEAVLCGSDGGLACAERLQHVLMPSKSNDIDAARRDKFLVNQACGEAGLAVAAQAAPCTWEAAAAFLETQTLPAVLKPRRGTASVGVFKVNSIEQAKEIYGILSRTVVSIDSSELGDGIVNCVAQELLEGDEWIVDTVSADGEHKVVALWRYEKGSANGAPFVYLSAELLSSSGADEAEALMDYACDCLDALKWRWGPAHIEVRYTPDGPKLIEVNAGRCNGLDFKLLADLAYGYNQFFATVAAWLAPDEFAALPSRPPEQLNCCAKLVTLVSNVGGTLKQINHEEELSNMQSLFSFEPEASEPGDIVKHTTDLNSFAGTAMMAHADPEVLDADYRRLRELQSTMFEVLEEEEALETV